MPLSLLMFADKVGRDWLYGFLQHHYDNPPRSLEIIPVTPVTDRCLLKLAGLSVIEMAVTSAGTNQLLLEIWQRQLPQHKFYAYSREWVVDFHAGELSRRLVHEARTNGPHIDIPTDSGQVVKGVVSFTFHAPVILYERIDKPNGGWVEKGRTIIDLQEDEWLKVFEQGQVGEGEYYEVYKQLITPLPTLPEPTELQPPLAEPASSEAQSERASAEQVALGPEVRTISQLESEIPTSKPEARKKRNGPGQPKRVERANPSDQTKRAIKVLEYWASHDGSLEQAITQTKDEVIAETRGQIELSQLKYERRKLKEEGKVYSKQAKG